MQQLNCGHIVTVTNSNRDCAGDLLESDCPPATSLLAESTLIVVLGMHRGGTSAITRAMETMGAEFGGNLGPPVAGVNDKGFFEDLDVHRINVEILRAVGAKWDTLSPIDLGKIAPAALDAFRARAAPILREKCDGKIFALKDPRISRLLPFWIPLFDELGIRVAYVIAVRSPTSVARSLQRRDGFRLEKSYLLWLAHMVPALRATSKRLRVLIDYDMLLDAPSAELARVSQYLGLPLNAESAALYAREFLEDRLRHWQVDAENLEATQSAPPHVGRLFHAIRSAIAIDTERNRAMLEAVLQEAESYLRSVAPRHEPSSRLDALTILRRAAASVWGLRAFTKT
jgi:hypothetical protein